VLKNFGPDTSDGEIYAIMLYRIAPDYLSAGERNIFDNLNDLKTYRETQEHIK
jgi:hypothetical protein